MTLITRLKKISGESIGRVTFQNRRTGPAPSIVAASYKEPGIPLSPAKYTIIPPPTPQRPMSTNAGIAQRAASSTGGMTVEWAPNQFGGREWKHATAGQRT